MNSISERYGRCTCADRLYYMCCHFAHTGPRRHTPRAHALCCLCHAQHSPYGNPRASRRIILQGLFGHVEFEDGGVFSTPSARRTRLIFIGRLQGLEDMLRKGPTSKAPATVVEAKKPAPAPTPTPASSSRGSGFASRMATMKFESDRMGGIGDFY